MIKKEQLNVEQLSALENITVGISNLVLNEKYKSVKVNERVFCLSGSSGCVDKDTEFLTPTGWKYISDFKEGDLIAQWNTDTTIDFIEPLRYIKQPTQGFYYFKSNTIDMMLSKDHKVPIITSKGNLVDRTAEYITTLSDFTIPRSFTLKDGLPELDIPDELLRVLIMQSADGSIAHKRIRINVKKDRKKERVIKLLTEANIPYNLCASHNGYLKLSYIAPDCINTKDLSILWGCSLRQLHIIYDEIIRWDGSTTKRKNVINKRFTGNKTNAELCQYVLSVCSGNYVTMAKDKRDYVIEDIYTVSESSRNNSSFHLKGIYKGRSKENKVDFIPSLDGYEYCFTTDSGYWLARRNGRIFPTGNCGKSTTTSLILKEFQDRGFNVLVTCPTHKAKKVITDMCDNAGVTFPSSTIHSYLGLKVKNNTETGKQDLVQNYGSNPPENYDIVICDEYSMIGKELLDYIMAEVELGTIKCVLFVGDSYQLLGVGEDESAVLTMKDINVFNLHQVMRQALENPIIEIATILRDCIISQKYLSNIEIKELFKERLGEHIEQVPDIKAMLNRYFSSTYEPDERSVIAYKNKTVSSLNSKIRNWIIDSDDCFVQGEELIFLSAMVENDNVVITNNEIVELTNLKKIKDDELDLYYWKLIDKEGRLFRVIDFNDKLDFEYELQELAKKAKKASGMERSAYWQRFFQLKETFQDVAYVYAGTIYKAQGSSYSEVYVHLNELLEMRKILGDESLTRALYVGITRAKDKLIVVC